MSLTGKVALVTGAASGVGAATAIALAKEGSRVTLVDRDEDKLKEIAKQCPQNITIKADVSVEKDVKGIIKEITKHFGRLDILVNNAGIIRTTSILDEDVMERYDLVMNINLRSMVYLTHLAAPLLIKSKGNIVNIASIAAHYTKGYKYLCYSISKAGVTNFTRCVAMELAEHGVRVNAISPGPTKSRIMENAGMVNADDVYKETTALKRLSEPEEMADLIVFLASDKAKGITGSTYVVDNGALLV